MFHRITESKRLQVALTCFLRFRFALGSRWQEGALIGLLCLGAVFGASAATSNVWVPTGLTVPPNGVILKGAGINPATNLPYRHLWLADHLRGFCRIDADIDAPATTHDVNPATCLPNAVPQGPTVFDPLTNTIYFADGGAKGLGVVKMRFNPQGDGGHGLVDLSLQEQIGAAGNGCGLPGNRTTSIALGPDGNLYVGVQKSGNITRIVNPGSSNVPCSSFQTIGATPDGRRTVALTWVGHDLFGIDGGSAFQIGNADQCVTPNNGNRACRGTAILAGGVLAAPQAIASDQPYPSVSGTTLYIGDVVSITKVQVAGLVVTPGWGTGVTFPTGLTVDTINPSNPVVFAGDDPTNGSGTLQGKIVRVNDAVQSAAPGAPSQVIATGGDAAATVSWTPGTPGTSPTIFYTVHTAGGSVPDQSTSVGAAVPNSLTVAGLVNGGSYTFTVDATNAVGTGSVSAPSNLVTPIAATAPGAPTAVSALAGDASALVAWSPPSFNGGSPITSYTISYSNNGMPTQVRADATATGLTVAGLVNSASYTFTVHASNAKGDGPESASSNAVTPVAPVSATNIALAMAAPQQVFSGASVTYTLTVTNTGNTTVPQVLLNEQLPVSGFSGSTMTVAQGVCAPVLNSVIACNLGAMAAGASTTAILTLGNVSAAVTNTANVVPKNAAGVALSETSVSDNSASVTTSLAPPPPAAGTTTDLQLGGSVSSSSPALNSNVVFTWQVKNSGKQTANKVIFTDVLPPSLLFQQIVSTSGATCGGAALGTSGTATCTLASLAAGQSLTISVTARVSALGAASNTGAVSFEGSDSRPDNNAATLSITAR
ncbi:fibronectin type III domain-containing protein [Variovorax sp. RHLX14]|uniref:fibronectin type III domain-containing protein n=1 Tax=Variovorax sp. RHLX14 TaxID=1259731 RepID=UPI003F450C5A